MTRHAHYLRTHESPTMPHNVVWFDTETDPEHIDPDTMVHRLSFGWAAHRRTSRSGEWSAPNWRRFTTAREFWLWVASKTRPKVKTLAFCHNTNFDLPVLDVFGELQSLGWRLHQAVIEGPPTILTFKRGSRTLQILDTLNIWRMPLATLGEHIGLEKLPFPDANATTEEWNRYGKRDVEIIMAACLAWWALISERDMGGFANTLAGQALRTYRYRHLSHRVLCDNNDRALGMARAAYVGGRTECRYIGHCGESTYLLDINSMYPHVMREHQYPTILRSVRTFIDTDELARWCDDGCAVADVELVTDMPAYPKQWDGKLIFPVGRFRTQLSTPEIQYAVERGHITKIYGACRYDSAPLFRSFIDEGYAWRQEYKAAGNKVGDFLVKINMNSLYGKFGQRGIVYEREYNTKDRRALVWEDVNAETGEITRFRQLGGLVQVQSTESESRDSHPAIAAHVTAHARMLLWRLERLAGDGHVLYMDTDSLLVDQVGYQRLLSHCDSGRLGALKLEGQFGDVEIYGPKDYVFGSKYRCKGVKKSALWTSPNQVEQEKWSSLRGLVRSGQTDRATTTRIRKKLKRSYTKGAVGADGWVSPLVFDGDALVSEG